MVAVSLKKDFFQAEDGIRDFCLSRGLGDVYKRQDIGKTADKVALEGIDALADFIKKIGLPTTLRELGIDDKDILPDIAASCNIAPGSYGDMNKKAIMEILVECY